MFDSAQTETHQLTSPQENDHPLVPVGLQDEIILHKTNEEIEME